jgi:adenylate cyclase class IV
MQRDVFLPTESSYLKLRYNTGSFEAIIWYERSTMPFARDSKFAKIDLDQNLALARLLPLLEAVRPVGVVEKHRIRFSDNSVIINVDRVVGVDSIVEIEALDDGSPTAQREVCERWTSALSITPAEIIPYSNIHLVQMYARRPTTFRMAGHMIALDDMFSQDLNTLTSECGRLLKRKIRIARVDCSVDASLSRTDTRLLDPISPTRYFLRCLCGDYCWFFDLAFSRGFGLPWEEVELTANDVLFVPLPPGGGPFFKRLFPSCMTVLLIPEAAMPEHQSTPVLNARSCLAEALRRYRETATQLRDHYDLVLEIQGRSDEQLGSVILDHAMRQPC